MRSGRPGFGGNPHQRPVFPRCSGNDTGIGVLSKIPAPMHEIGIPEFFLPVEKQQAAARKIFHQEALPSGSAIFPRQTEAL